MAFDFLWAGGSAPLIDFQYSAHIGISPQPAVFRVAPTVGPPGLTGDLQFTDGATTITLTDCYLDGVQESLGASGRTWMIRVLDRRWRWELGPGIDGLYNQIDRRSKLIPWTVRSPTQLARLLYAAMDEPIRTCVLGSFSTAATYTVVVNGVTFEEAGADYASFAELTAAFADAINGSVNPAIVDRVEASTSDHGGWLYLSPVGMAALPVVIVSATGLPSGGSWYAIDPIDLPEGLAVAKDDDLDIPAPDFTDTVVDAEADYLQLGANLLQTGTNPPTAWVASNVARSLASLAEEYGRVVVWDPITDTTTIQRLGHGVGLPDGPILTQAPSVDPRQVPSAIKIVGAPIRYQVRLRFRGVAREWDDSWRTHSQASYAPERAEQEMRCIAIGNGFDTDGTYAVVINGVSFTADASSNPSLTAVASALASAINASTDPAIEDIILASAADGQLTVETDPGGAQVGIGYEFTITTVGTTIDSPATWEARCTKGPIPIVPYPTNMVVTITGTWAEDSTYAVTINDFLFDASGLVYPNIATAVVALALQINTEFDPTGDHTGKVWAATGGDNLIITVTEPGDDPIITLDGTELIDDATWTMTVVNGPLTTTGGRGFERSLPPAGFWNVRVTGRLGFRRAKELAESSVYRCYQLVAVNPYSGADTGIPIPSLADPITNRFRIILEGTRPDQTAPRPGDANRLDPLTGQPFAAEVYNGFSKDREPACFGSVWPFVGAGGVWARREGLVLGNTPKDSQFYVPFNIVDPERQIIQFAQPVMRLLGGVVLQPEIVVETGVIVLEEGTYSPMRFTYTLPVPTGAGPVQSIVRDEVQKEIIGEYSESHQLLGSHAYDADADNRAEYYAQAALLPYVATAGNTNRYVGFQLVQLSGLVRQVSWNMSRGGALTTASANTEFSPNVPPYPTRRRRENLSVDAQQALQNLSSSPVARRFRNAVGQVSSAVGRVGSWLGFGSG